MKQRWFTWLAGMLLLVLALPSHATVTCNVSSAGVFGAYSPSTVGNTVVQSSFTVTCTRSAGDLTPSVAYTVVPDNGIHTGSNVNLAAFGASLLGYSVYKNSICNQPWSSNNAEFIAGTVIFGGSSGAQTTNFWACIAPGQSRPAGTYTDTVTLTLSYGSGTVKTSSFPVSISTPATCSISSVPGTVAFGTYTSFGGALGASTAFGATCTQYFPYTIDVSPTTGTIVGLNYSLLLQNAAPVMSGTSLAVTGSGVQQTYTISGSMAAGQGGVCPSGNCFGTVPHTLTISY